MRDVIGERYFSDVIGERHFSDVIGERPAQQYTYVAFGRVHIVVEAVFDGGPVAEVASIYAFHGLTEDVGRGMPEHGLKMG